MLVHVATLPERRKSYAGTCSSPVCWHIYLPGVCIRTNVLANVATGWHIYQPTGAVYRQLGALRSPDPDDGKSFALN